MLQKGNNRHLEILDFIIQFKCEHDGLSPTVREIAAHFPFATTTVAYYLDVLHMRGFIEYIGKGKMRGIMVNGGEWRLARRSLAMILSGKEIIHDNVD